MSVTGRRRPTTLGRVGLWIAIIVAAVVVLAIVLAIVVLLIRRRSVSPAAETVPVAARPNVADAAPMTDLESALNSVTDRTGRPMAERLDAEAAHVDEFRVPDDTGPLLRRALDSVERHDAPHGGSDAATDEQA